MSSVAKIFGTWYYKEYLKDVETRTILFWGTVLAVVSSGLSIAWVLRWNIAIGISDVAFILFTDVVIGPLGRATGTLPQLALFAKVTPKGIEGTIFALLTGIYDLTSFTISPALGSWVNSKFVHVTKEDFNKNDLHRYL